MKTAQEMEQVFKEILPWTHQSTGVTADLISVRDGDSWEDNYFIIVVQLTQENNDDTTIVGSIKYHYWPETDTIEAVYFQTDIQGMLLLKDYHDYSCQSFLDRGFNGKTKALHPAVMQVYEDFGWKRSEEDSKIWVITPEDKNAN